MVDRDQVLESLTKENSKLIQENKRFSDIIDQFEIREINSKAFEDQFQRKQQSKDQVLQDFKLKLAAKEEEIETLKERVL